MQSVGYLGKKRCMKRPLITKYVLDLCGERSDFKQMRYQAEGAKAYREANKRIESAVKEAKED